MPIVDRPDGKPRHQCDKFMTKSGIKKPKLMTKKEFNGLTREAKFKAGPFRDNFGDGYGEPYNPYRQAFGVLEDGKGVFCEL